MRAPLPVCLWAYTDGEFRITDVNEAGCRFTGLARSELVGTRPGESGGDANRVKRDLKRALTEQATIRRRQTSVDINGMPRALEVIYVGIGKDAVLAFALDISARLTAEHRLQQTEDRFRALVAAANEGIWLSDPDGLATFVNARAASMLAMSVDEIIGRQLSEFVVESDAATLWSETGDGSARVEVRLKRGDGSRLNAIVSTSAIHNDLGELTGRVALLSDVTSLKRDEAELRESHERFAQMYTCAPAGMLFIGAGRSVRGKILAANSAFQDLVGYSEDELVERDIWSLTHDADLEAESTCAAEMFERGGDGYELEKRFLRADGTAVWARFRAHILRDERGAPLYVVGVAIDTTAEHEAAARAATWAARMHALFEGGTDAVLDLDHDGTVTDASAEALRMLGLDHDEVIGRPVNEVVAEHLRGRTRETHYGLGDETRTLLYLEHEPAENQSDSDAQMLRALFDESPTATARIDREGRISSANAALCRLTARTPAELIGQPARNLFVGADDERAPWERDDAENEPVTLSRRVARADGTAVGASLTVMAMRDGWGAPSEWICQCVPSAAALATPLESTHELSYRERQVLSLLAKGLDGPAIGERLGLAPETVRSYTQSARDKTGAATRTEAVVRALIHGEITI